MGAQNSVVHGLVQAAGRWDPTIHDHAADTRVGLDALLDTALSNASTLAGRQGETGQLRIGILMPNSLAWLEALITTLAAGSAGVPLPLPSGFGGPQAYMDHIPLLADTARLDAIIYNAADLAPTVRALRSRLNGVEFLDISGWPTARPASVTEAADDPRIIQFTSGSTSRPKGVILTAANISAAVAILAEHFFLTPTDALGNWLPFFHDMGLFMTLAALTHGSSLHLWTPSQAARRPLAWLRQFAENRCTVAAAPNFFYSQLADAAAKEGTPADLDLSTWRVAINGSETVRADTIERFTRAFRPAGFHEAAMWPSYGLAEATLPAAIHRPGLGFTTRAVARGDLAPGEPVRFTAVGAPGSRTVVGCGRQLRGTGLRVTDPHGNPLPEAHLGEIQLRSPTVMAGYLDRPAAEAPVTSEGWLITGDLGFLSDGELFITGRTKNVAIINGQNVYAEDLEHLVRDALGDQVRCGVTAGMDEEDREFILICFEHSGTYEEQSEAVTLVRNQVSAALGGFRATVVALPDRQLPHTTSGKIRRAALADVAGRYL